MLSRIKQTNSDNAERSRAHRRVEKILDEISLDYESEVKFPPYKLDIYLHEFHIGIEIDGPFHSRNKDRIRDEFLESNYGLKILRLNIQKKSWIRKENVIESITKFIEENEINSQERKEIWLNKLA